MNYDGVLKQLYAIGILLLLLCGCSGTSRENVSNPLTQAQVQEFFDRYSDLWMAPDIDGWLALWVNNDRIVQMPPGEPRVVGMDALRERNSRAIEAASYQVSINNLDVRTSGDLAFASGVYTMDIAPSDGSEPWKLDAKYLSIFERQPDGSWKLIRDAFNSNN